MNLGAPLFLSLLTLGACSGRQPIAAVPNPGVEVCANSLDDDADGEVDEASCSELSCVPAEELCRDRLDNDCDGVIDEADCVPPCHGHEDCPAGQACQWETGRCRAPQAEECGVPVDEGGSARLGNPCDSRDPCGPSMTCVTITHVMDRETGVYGPLGEGAANFPSWCFASCDPCAPSCPEGSQCLAREGGQAFCVTGLAQKGELCGGGGGGSDPCEFGNHCPKLSAGESHCEEVCTPDDPAYWGFPPMGSAGPSADCLGHEICQFLYHWPGGTNFACIDNPLTDVGDPCLARGCLWPVSCAGSGWPGQSPLDGSSFDGYFPVGWCSEDCLAPGASCPAGTQCMRYPADGSRGMCIKPAESLADSPCTEDAHCGGVSQGCSATGRCEILSQ